MNRERKLQGVIACFVLAAAAPGYVLGQAPKPPEPLGRLFFTPAQRAQLDVARTQRARTALATERSEDAQAAPTPQTITYEGAVRRSDGKTTVFINNRPVTEKESASGAVIVGKVRQDGGVSLQIPQSGRAVELKPGQSLELLSGTIEERYARKPVAPEPNPAKKPSVDAKPEPKSASSDPAAIARKFDEQEQQRIKDAVSQVMRDTANARSAPGTPAPGGSLPAR